MKYKNVDTGEVWTLEEVKEAYEDFKHEIADEAKSFEDYLDDMLDMGRRKEGGLEEIEAMWVADRCTGSFIEKVDSIAAGMAIIKQFEDEDRANGDYTPDFYEIVDQDHCSIA